MSSLPRIIVAICTYKRNEPLRTLLSALVEIAAATSGRADVGVVVVDDNPDQRAKEVVVDFETAFALGLRYRTSGQANISIARNLAVNTALEDADWIAMVDDDCEPEPSWLNAYLDVLEATGADCATGSMNLRVPPGSPAWLSEQPFFDDVRFDFEDGAAMELAATNNSIIRGAFLRDNPEIRFEKRYGKLGGEDMVFYDTAHAAGLKIRFVRNAEVWGNEPPKRANSSTSSCTASGWVTRCSSRSVISAMRSRDFFFGAEIIAARPCCTHLRGCSASTLPTGATASHRSRVVSG